MNVAALEHSICPSCGAELNGRFCSGCGEPVPHDGDLSLRHLTHDFLHEFTHLDGKIWRTIHALLLKPGLLTVEYWAGRRGNCIRPLRLYLVISALTLLLAASAAGPLGLRIWVTGARSYSVGSHPVNKPGVAPINDELSHRIQSIYLWTRYLSLGVFAAASLAVYRKRQRYYGAHLIFAMHYYSFEYVLSGSMAKAGEEFAEVATLVAIGIGFVYLCLSLRRLHGESWFRTIVKSSFLFLAVSVAELLTVTTAVFASVKFWKQ